MKKVEINIIICLSFFSSIFSQPNGWSEDVIIPSPPHLNCVSSYVCIFRPYRAGWIGGINGVILYTSNSGTNWIYRTSSLIGTNSVNAIEAINDSIALCAFNSSNTTYILRTTNMGVNWQSIFQQQNGFIRSIRFDYNYGITWFCSPTTGYAIGDPVGGRWTIFKTTNTGISFDSAGLYVAQSGSETSFNNSLECWYPFVIFGTNSSKIYRSTNQGINWSSIAIPYQNVASIAFNGPSWVAYTGGILTAKSTNGGINWQLITLPGTGNCIFNSLSGYSGWYVKGQEIYRTTTSGNWIFSYLTPNGGNYTDISLRLSVFESGILAGWAVKDNGTVSKYFATIAGIKKIENYIPEDFSLSQNYPNPFNPNTKIKFDIPSLVRRGAGLRLNGVEDSWRVVVLKVYDILGREIATLVNEKLSPGTYEVEFDGTNYASGVYYYTLTAGKYTDTKKMVLMK